MTPKRRALNLSVIFACLCFSKSLLIKRIPYELHKLSLTCFKDIEEYSGCCNSFDDQLQIY